MPISKATESVLLITHPQGSKSFDYGDHWDGADLIYTGRGQLGDQQRIGANRDVAENRRTLYVFEAAGPRMLRYLGAPLCVEERVERERDRNGSMRNVLRFRLRFPDAQGRLHTAVSDQPFASPQGRRQVPERRARPFDPDARPGSRTSPGSTLDLSEVAALQEKASERHHQILCRLSQWLAREGWQDIEEIPAAIDLRAVAPDGTRVIFEAKSISDTNEVAQTRAAVAQLLEYRLEYGQPDHRLCIVVNAPLSARRVRLLEGLAITTLVASHGRVVAGNDLAWEMIRPNSGACPTCSGAARRPTG